MVKVSYLTCLCSLCRRVGKLSKEFCVLDEKMKELEKNQGASGFLHVREQLASGVAPAFPNGAGTTVRRINTVVENTIEGAEIVVDQRRIILPAGTYDFRAIAPSGNCVKSQLYLINNAGQVFLKGTSGTTLNSYGYAEVVGRVVFEDVTSFGIYHGLGAALEGEQNIGVANSIGGFEVYTEFLAWKIA